MSNTSRSWGDSFERRPARQRGGRSSYEHTRDGESTEQQIKKRANRGAQKATSAEDNTMNSSNNHNDNKIDAAADAARNGIDAAAEAAHAAAAAAAGSAEDILRATGSVVDGLTEEAAAAAAAEAERAERLRQDNDRLEEAEARANAHTGGFVGGLKKVAGYSAIVGVAALGGYYLVKGIARLTAGEAATEAVDEAAKAAFLGR